MKKRVWKSRTHAPQDNWRGAWPLQQSDSMYHNMINMLFIEKLGGAVAPRGLQGDPPLQVQA
jgi:hypothetical protein